jgi:PIN domain nuclease of toxin-antitoxin system
VNCLLDTHFLVWIMVGVTRLDAFPWLDDYRPWGVSPVSLLELQFLSEVGKLELDSDRLLETLPEDRRFVVDEVPLLGLIRQAIPLGWTRDPFDRLLAAHSTTRRVPLCTVDRAMLRHHRYVVKHLRE